MMNMGPRGSQDIIDSLDMILHYFVTAIYCVPIYLQIKYVVIC